MIEEKAKLRADLLPRLHGAESASQSPRIKSPAGTCFDVATCIFTGPPLHSFSPGEPNGLESARCGETPAC
jgi:hypothetical protein